VKALSIRQPWAWCILHGRKRVENRTWTTDYRGWLLLHSGVTMSRSDYDECDEVCARLTHVELPPRDSRALLRGGIVGAAELIDVVENDSTHPVFNSPWAFGPCLWIFDRVTPLGFVPCRGRLSLFDLPYHLETHDGILTIREGA